jgi:hypothetical protein
MAFCIPQAAALPDTDTKKAMQHNMVQVGCIANGCCANFDLNSTLSKNYETVMSRQAWIGAHAR